MKNLYTNKILPLTMKQLKKAQLQYRSRKNTIYDMASYQFITVVARVVKVSAMQIKLTDDTDMLEIQFFPSALKKSVDPIVGKYYRFSFFPRRNAMNNSSSNSADVFTFEIVGMMIIKPNQITDHLVSCMKQKKGRESFGSSNKLKDQTTRVEISSSEQESPQKLTVKTNGSNLSISNNKKSNGESQISRYCKELGKEFDVDSIVTHFGQKYTIKDVEKVLEILSEKGLIMDLGLVYEWVGEQE